MKKALLPLCFLLAAAAAAQQHVMTFDDLAAIRRIGAPQVSPDGRWIAYDASTIDMKTNYRRSAIYLAPAAGGPSKQITDGIKQDEGPAWAPDGKRIAYVSNRDSGAKQVWIYSVDTAVNRKLTDLPGGAASVKWTPDGRALVLVSDIYPDCGVDPDCIRQKTAAEEASPTQARVLSSLLYRHWKAWQAPTRAHILL